MQVDPYQDTYSTNFNPYDYDKAAADKETLKAEEAGLQQSVGNYTAGMQEATDTLKKMAQEDSNS